MSVQLGLACKLYYSTTGIGGTPTPIEVPSVKDVKMPLTKGEADVSTRGNNGWKASVGTLKDGSADFQLVADKDADAYRDLLAAFLDNSIVGVFIADGDIDADGTEYFSYDAMVTKFERSEPLEGAVTIDVSVKPTYSANVPDFHTVGGATTRVRFSKSMSGGVATIDLTALVDVSGTSVDGTGKKVLSVTLTNPSAHAITVAKGATNGYTGLGAAFSVSVAALGGVVTVAEAAGATAIASGNKTLDLAGTTTEALGVSLLLA